MKRNFTTLDQLRGVMVLFLFIVSVISYAQTVPEYMYFKFDAPGNQTNFASAPVGNNPATLTGLTIGSTGQFGTALVGNFVASNYLNTGWATNLPATGWTISMWLNSLPSDLNLYYLWGDVNASAFRCFLNGAAGAGNVLLRRTGWTDVLVSGVAPGPIVLTFVYTGTSIKYYKNGVLSGTVPEVNVAVTGTGPFLIGAYSTLQGLPSGGLMDEFRMYNRELTDAEVTLTWNQPLPIVTGPIVVTTAATGIASAAATLNGTVNANNSSTTVTFEYGLTTAYGTVVPGIPSPVTGNTVTPVSAAISGLLPNTLYHYRVNGVNANGTANGSDMTFTTLVAAPTVVTTAATGIGLITATLNGTVNANGSSTAVTFQYGLTVAYGSTVTAVPSPVSGSIVTAVSAAIAGLTSNTLYHYRVVGTNAGGTSNGTDLTFTTAGAPTVVTNPASLITNTTAQLNGTVTANNLSTTVSFDWGLTIAYGNNLAGTPSPLSGNISTPVLANIAGLVLGNTYHFRCNASNAGGTVNGADQSFTAGCQAPGAAGPITGPTTVCASTPCNIVYSISPIPTATSYTWTLNPSGTICAGQGTTSITMNWNNPPSGSVTVSGTNGCGNGISSGLSVVINPAPVPTITGSATVCQGTTGNIYTTQPGMTNYTWTVSAGGTIVGPSNANTISVTWNTSGAKTVSVNYNNVFGCSAATPTVFNVTVNAAPVPTITGQASMCVNSGNYNYSTQSGFSNYTWTVSAGGTIISGQGTSLAQVSWTGSGAQTVSVVYSNALGCYPATPGVLNVTVNPLPGNAGSITGPSSVCAGAIGVTYSVSPIANASSYVWILPPGATIASGAGTNAITVNFAANASSGNITVNGNNLCGAGNSSLPFPVTINPIAADAGTITGPSSVCQGDNGVVFSVNPIANATTYNWTVPTGGTIISGGNTNTITVNFSSSASSGTVSVYGSNSCGNGAASNLNITLNPVPAAPLISSLGLVLSSNAPAGNQWYYSVNAGGPFSPIAGATGQTYTVTQQGYYYDIVTLNGCSSAPSNILWLGWDGITNVSGSGVIIYPIPNDGRFNLSFTGSSSDKYSVIVMNNLGVKLYELNDIIIKGNTGIIIDLRPVPDGVYTVIIYNNQNRIVKKIMVNK